ncbi:MAG: hypothetical protein Q9216_000971 [Gyalolechia sp. 2 TL-2023]
MASASATQRLSLKRKVGESPEQSVKKTRHTEGVCAGNSVLQGGYAATCSIPTPHFGDSDSDSEYNTGAGSDDDNGSHHDAATNTPLTPFSPNPSPRFPSELKTHLCTYSNCGKAFNRPAKLAQHILSHTKVRPLLCPHKPCTKDFLRQSHLQHHIKSAHSNVRDYTCQWEGCGKSFLTATRLKRHHAAHEGKEKFKCNVHGCGQTFRKHGTLNKHVATEHEGKKPFECQLPDEVGNICGQSFDTSGKLRAHEGRLHGGRRFWCSICSSHTATAMKEGTTGFSTYAELQEHIKVIHPPQCEICGLSCKSQRDLKHHVEIRHGVSSMDERRIHICEEPDCGRAFTKRGNLKAHTQSAHKAKKYVCGEVEIETLNNVNGWDGLNACGRGLSTKGSLESHIRTAHMGMGRRRSKTRKKQISDPAQEQNVNDLNLLKLTGVGYEEYSGRHVVCLIRECEFRFGRSYDLQVHLVSRHGLSECEAKSLVASVEADFDDWTTGYDDLPNDSTEGNPSDFSNFFGDNISHGEYFWVGGDFDEYHDREDDDWLEDEREMQELVENAIEIALNPAADQNLKSQALVFIHQLPSDPQSWRICLSLFVREPRCSHIVRHTSLDVLDNAVASGQLDIQALTAIRENLIAYAQGMYGSMTADQNTIDSPHLQNKLAQTFTYLFASLYPSQWLSFFHDMLALTASPGSPTRNNATGSIFFLRILIQIHDDIADIFLSRSSDDKKKNTELKDLIRERDAKTIAASWQEILSYWRGKDPKVIDLCLATIGRWVSWTEISLIITETLRDQLLELVTSPMPQDGSISLRDTALTTLKEILHKKMGSDYKLELINLLKIREVVGHLVTSPALADLRATSQYDTDLAESVAQLVNQSVSDIVRALETAQDQSTIMIQGVAQLKEFLPLVLRFFSDEYDEICSTVIPCLSDLLTLFRKKEGLSITIREQSSAMLSPLFDAVVTKMRYDETSSWGNEDAQTDEAEFQELRKRLHVLQQAIALVDDHLYQEKISTVVVSTFENFQRGGSQIDWRDLDLALHEMYLFGEYALKSGALYSKTKPITPAAERLIAMMYKLVDSGVASSLHPAVQLQYMEICVRYYHFFDTNPQYISATLERFVQCVHHDHVKVRTRSWYLFQRFVKHTRQHIGDIAQTIIQALSDLLPIKAEIPDEVSDNSDMSSEEDQQTPSARFDSQLYLYEAIGSICSARGVLVEDQVVHIRTVITPLFSDLEVHLGPAKDGDELAVMQVHHLIMALGTLARGFSDWTPAHTSPAAAPPATEVSEEFSRTSEAILIALESVSINSEVIRAAARFAFSRLVGVLGSRILPQLPRWIDGLLSHTSSKDEMALFMRLLDQVVFGFKTEIYSILDTLLTPLLQRVFAGIAEPATGTDDEIQLAELKREYLCFLLVILNNSLESVLVSEANQAGFATVISTIEHLAKDASDFPTAKLAFTVLTRMVMTWGGQDIQTGSPQPTLPGFDRFMMERFSPLCWALPSQPNFDPKDAYGRQAMGEAAGLQKAIYTKTGEEYLSYLRNTELNGMGMDAGTVDEYLRALSNTDGKAFKQYFQSLVQRSKR